MSWIDDFFSQRYYQQVTIDRPDLVEYRKKSKHFQNSILNLQGLKNVLFLRKKEKREKKKMKAMKNGLLLILWIQINILSIKNPPREKYV